MARGLIGGAGKMSVAAASSGARVFFFLDEFLLSEKMASGIGEKKIYPGLISGF